VTNTTPVVDTTGNKIDNARKSIAAGVSAAFAASIPLVGAALTDGVVTGQEAGGIAAAFAGALVTVGYVTWQTVNKPKPTDVAALDAQVTQLAAASAPIVVVAAPGAVEDDSLADPDELAAHDAALFSDDEEPKHSL